MRGFRSLMVSILPAGTLRKPTDVQKHALAVQ